MASGLSVESLVKTLAMAVLAPACGYLADLAGVGITVAAAGVLMGFLYIPLRIRISGQESASAL